jgi:ketosteroid isomerase-like protein
VSEENVETVRRGYELLNGGDVESALEFVHPAIEWQTYLVPGPGGGLYRGHDGVRELWRDVRNVFGGYRNDPEELIDAGDKVVAFICISGRGTLSGVEVEARIAHVFTFSDGKILRVQSFEDRAEALRAAGLRR